MKLKLNLDTIEDYMSPKQPKLSYSPSFESASAPYFQPIKQNLDKMSLNDLIDKFLSGRPNEIAKNVMNKLNSSNQSTNKLSFSSIINTFQPKGSHGIRNFDINEPNNPKYRSYVYISNNYVAKVYNYDCGELSEYMLIKEIAYQIYASELTSVCNFTTPLIQNYGKLLKSDVKDQHFVQGYPFDCIMFIIMDKMLYSNLQDAVKDIDLNNLETCNKISSKINTLTRCLEDNNLHHNDLNVENILLDYKPNGDIQLGLIDYGNANGEATSFTDWEYTCDKLKGIKQKSPYEITTSFSPFGGRRRFKRSKKRSKKRSNKRRRTRRHR
jgi:hypothetical protein